MNPGTKPSSSWTRSQKTSWHLIDLENVHKSLNLDSKFGMTFSDIHILNDSASKLWALENGRIHIIDTNSQTSSKKAKRVLLLFSTLKTRNRISQWPWVVTGTSLGSHIAPIIAFSYLVAPTHLSIALSKDSLKEFR